MKLRHQVDSSYFSIKLPELTFTDLEATGLERDHLPFNLHSITTTSRPSTTRPTARPRTKPSTPATKNTVALRKGMYTHAIGLHKPNTPSTRKVSQTSSGNSNNLISKHPLRTPGLSNKRLLPQLAGGSQPPTRLRSLPTLAPDDTTVFYCSGSLVGRLNLVQGKLFTCSLCSSYRTFTNRSHQQHVEKWNIS